MTALSPAREAAAVLSDRELSDALGLWYRLRDEDGTLRETVARAIAEEECAHVLHQGQWCSCGWQVPSGDPAWVVRAHEHRCRTNADAAIEALRGTR